MVYPEISILYSFEIRKLTFLYRSFKRKIPSKIAVRCRLSQIDDFSPMDSMKLGEHYFCNIVRFGSVANWTDFEMVLSVFDTSLKEYFAFDSNFQHPFLTFSDMLRRWPRLEFAELGLYRNDHLLNWSFWRFVEQPDSLQHVRRTWL